MSSLPSPVRESGSPTVECVCIDVDGKSPTGRKQRLRVGSLINFRVRTYSTDRRRNYPGLDDLIYDDWDTQSLHLLAVRKGEIIGALRICTAKNGKLPFSDDLPNVAATSNDTEVSRLVVKQSERHRSAALILMVAAGLIVEECGSKNIFIDALCGGIDTLGERSLRHMGFTYTGQEYMDHRYGLMSRLYKCDDPALYGAWAQLRQRIMATPHRR
jgi:predicted GNAT family N-acyltransferase